MNNRIKLVSLVLSIIVFCILVVIFWDYSIDDAFITFRYAANFANGHGLTLNPGDPPVEAYSNFLWLLLLAGLYKIGLPIFMTSKIIGIISILAAGILWQVKSYKGNNDWGFLAGVLFLIIPYSAFWAVSGLELGLYALLLTLLWFQLEKRSYSAVIILPLLVLCRPEGAVIGGVMILAKYFFGDIETRLSGKFLMVSIVTIALTAGLLTLFRYLYFGYPFTNTVYIKSTLMIDGTIRLIEGLVFLAPLTLMFLYTIYLLIKRKVFRTDLIPAAILFLVMGGINCLADAVMNFHFRYMTPFLPFFLLVAVYMMNDVKAKPITIIAVILIALSTWSPIFKILDFIERERLIIRSQEVLIDYINNEASGKRISMTDIGRVPFYTDALYYDIWGLASEDIAHNGFIAGKELIRFPDYFIFVGNAIDDRIFLRFGKERMIFQHKFFNMIYHPAFSTQAESNLDEDAYNYLVFKKDPEKLDSLLKLYPIN